MGKYMLLCPNLENNEGKIAFAFHSSVAHALLATLRAAEADESKKLSVDNRGTLY